MKRIILYSNIASHYRSYLWLKFIKISEAEFHFYYGDPGKTGIKEIDFSTQEFGEYHNRIHKLKNYWIFNKAVIWQSGVIRSSLRDKIDIAIFTGEMYCISTWVASIICRLRKIEVVFWGHGIYGSEGTTKLFIRKLFYKLANKHLLYSQQAKKLMINLGFNTEDLFIIFNSLNYELHKSLREKFKNLSKTDVFGFFNNPILPVLVFIGRLTVEKKIEQLISVTRELNKAETKVNLLIIGNGIEKEHLTLLGNDGITKKWLHFTGALYDEEMNGKFLFCSDLCISPGNVGLTAIHSLSFGTPVSTHSNFSNQGPEVGSVIDNYNGFLFKENNIHDLKNKIAIWLEKQLTGKPSEHNVISLQID
jgi:glycosyltransferase involved in cell wall biosynthesis